jgi:hypothetical protein
MSGCQPEVVVVVVVASSGFVVSQRDSKRERDNVVHIGIHCG